jgi:Flp pilus assembly protein TadG
VNQQHKGIESEGNPMKCKRQKMLVILDNKGTVAVIVALLLIVIIGAAAMAIDVGRLAVSKNELQNAADAGALAAARRLGANYENMTYAQQQAYILSATHEVQIEDSAIEVVLRNRAAGANITLERGDILIGTWNPSQTPDSFTETDNQPTAVRVTTRRDAQVNNPVSLFFARIFGIQEAPVRAVATAALTALSEVQPGELELPIGISMNWFARGTFCGESITFYPTRESCAGWTDFESDNRSVPDPALRNILRGLTRGTYTAPGATFGETQFAFTGGTLSQITFQALEDLYMQRRDPVTGIYESLVVVYENPGDTTTSCGNPNDLYVIRGFATIHLRVVYDATGGKYLEGTVICDYIDTGRGSGGNFGTLGSIPGLVQ